MIENLFRDKMTKKWNDHDGDGYILAFRILKHQQQFKTDFIDIAVVPPTASIGYHKHGKNQETYVVLKGQGIMHCGEDIIPISEGDIIANPCFGEHGLINNSHENILLLVFQTSESKQNKIEGRNEGGQAV